MGLFESLKKKKTQSMSKTQSVRASNQHSSAPDSYIADLKKYAIRFIPGDINEIQTQRQMLNMIDPVFPVSVFLGISIPTDINIQRVLETNDLGNRPIIQLQGAIAVEIDRWIKIIKEKEALRKIRNTNTDVLLNAWIALAFYCDILDPEYKVNLQKYFRLIVDEIYSRQFSIPVVEEVVPISFSGNSIYIDSKKLLTWKKQNPITPQYKLCGVMPLTEKEPVISLFEDGVKTREYRLQTEGAEDFTGKYFSICVALGFFGDPAVPVAQIDGFVSDTPEERKMTINDIGYRMEGHFLACGGDAGKQQYEMLRGQDLPMKALKYQGYTTPANIRLIGVCPDCGKSFCFHGYAFYMTQCDVAYSDDGLDCCKIQANNIDKNTWSYETDEKTFRYYNSFNCPHCGTPYIDYKKYPDSKEFGVSGCVLLGRKAYNAEA